MLIRYSVENFKSIRDKVELSMEAIGISELKETLIAGKDGEKYLPLAAIYGPNGGGKSNILESLFCLRSKIIVPIISSIKGISDNSAKTAEITPFLFNYENVNKPTVFEIAFTNNLGEYHFSISIQGLNVLSESLEMIKFSTKKPSKLFERKGNNIKLGRDFSKIVIPDLLSDEVSFLSFLGITYGENELVKDITNWWIKQITVENYGDPFYDIVFVEPGDEKTKKLFMELLKEMDIGIVDYIVKDFNDKTRRMYTIHKTGDKSTEIRLLDESSGTRKMFSMALLLLECLIFGKTLVIDELDAKLHPLMIKKIIQMFNEKSSNSNGAQLIFTSHDMYTLSNELLRRDEIWFAAKGNSEDTQLYSLIDFKGEGEIKTETVRKDAKYSKQYLEGKYGADPYFQRIINWDEVHNEQKTE